MTIEPAQPFESEDPGARIRRHPRNPWTRLRVVLDHVRDGRFDAAYRLLDGLRHHPDVTPDLLELYEARLMTAAAGTVRRINLPADYTGSADPRLLRPFRRLDPVTDFPVPYPWAMALPGFTGAANDTRFLLDTAAGLAPGAATAVRRIHVLWSPLGTAPAARADLLAALHNQGFAGRVDLTIFDATDGGASAALPGGGGIVSCPHALPSPEGLAAIGRVAPQADLLVFLSGNALPDPTLLKRACQLAGVSDAVVQPLVPPPETAGFATLLSAAPLRPQFSGRYPFREVAGLNMIVPASLLVAAGLPDPRFSSTLMAARELAYRLYVRGAWFEPQALVRLEGFDDSTESPADLELYKALSPNHWDRKRNLPHEVAKVTVYIPAWNASKYIERAVDSVLAQDMADVDVCIANDGSSDETLAVLERRYGAEPRVRWRDHPNGGIGFASNQAISMSRSLYIGQLDSDDRLLPGAVRRLTEYLDDNAAVACVYSSCERIDAQGARVRDEYSWPMFSREKMMITSIAHHFRMFRRQAWARSGGFREDIVNGIDYDIFLKISELGAFHHIDEILYQRRWHGQNTSLVNEAHQTTNTHRAQRAALHRQGLAPFWELHVLDPDLPRNVTYRLRSGTRMVAFWPDYSRSNPYQNLLYAGLRQHAEVVAGDIDAALKLIDSQTAPAADITFHLHWLNALFPPGIDEAGAQVAAAAFLARIEEFVAKGGHFVWTLHNTLSHDSPFAAIERDLSARLAERAHVLHVHSAASIPELAQAFPLPAAKVRVLRHGHYIGAYPDHVGRADARRLLGIAPDEDVILFTGQIRAYKGVDGLVAAFRAILADRPQARLVLAGKAEADPLLGLDLTPAERARILTTGRAVEAGEFQLFFRAADLAVYPYRHILTSGSLMLALGFGTPVVVPRVGMTAEVLDGRNAGRLYDGAGGTVALEAAIRDLLATKDAGWLEAMGANARALAETLDWPDAGALLD